jgi:uncharacterized membrane protein YfcA
MKQRPTVMIAPSILGLLGLYQVLTDDRRLLGLFLVMVAVVGWVMMFTVEASPDARQPNRLVLAGLVALTAGIGFTLSAVTR